MVSLRTNHKIGTTMRSALPWRTHDQENKRFRQNVFPNYSGPHARDAALGCLPSPPCAADDGSQHSSQPERHRCAANLRRYAFLSASIASPYSSYRTASVIAVIDISAKIGSLCFQYSQAVKEAKDDIERVQRKVGDIERIQKDVKKLLEGRHKARFSTTNRLFDSLSQCLQELKDLKVKLDPGKTRKAMSRFGVRALQWPFTSKQVDKIVSNLERYERIFGLALQVDQT
jgi:hypothetical protein